MSVFADDLLLVAPRNELEKVMRSIDADIEVKWGDTLGPAWSRYLGKDWRYEGTNVQVRMPVHYWKELLAEFGLTDCRPVKTPSELKVEEDTTAAVPPRRRQGDVRRSDPSGRAVHGEGTGTPIGSSNWS